MVFCNNIQHAINVAKILQKICPDKGVYLYHSKVPHKIAILSEFKKNPNSIIVGVGALDEGFDDDQVNVILDFTVYIKMIRRILQRAGRA